MEEMGQASVTDCEITHCKIKLWISMLMWTVWAVDQSYYNHKSSCWDSPLITGIKRCKACWNSSHSLWGPC